MCAYMLEGGCFNQACIFNIIKSQRFAFYFLLEAFVGDLISISSVLCGRERIRDLEKLTHCSKVVLLYYVFNPSDAYAQGSSLTQSKYV